MSTKFVQQFLIKFMKINQSKLMNNMLVISQTYK